MICRVDSPFSWLPVQAFLQKKCTDKQKYSSVAVDQSRSSRMPGIGQKRTFKACTKLGSTHLL